RLRRIALRRGGGRFARVATGLACRCFLEAIGIAFWNAGGVNVGMQPARTHSVRRPCPLQKSRATRRSDDCVGVGAGNCAWWGTILGLKSRVTGPSLAVRWCTD